jgi:dTDP-4-dehydrorhamnose 3,5-epimerase
MNITKSEKFPDVLILEPKIFRDCRGYFYESFNMNMFQKEVGGFNIVQANESKSKLGVVRGLHFQKPPYTQAKLIQVIKGEVLDIIVDIRTDSSTFGEHMSILLNGTNKKHLYIPRGYAHGFITLSKDAIFQYFVDNIYSPSHESGVLYNDKDLKIDWIKKYKVIVSEKDKLLKHFNECTFHTTEEYLLNS